MNSFNLNTFDFLSTKSLVSPQFCLLIILHYSIVSGEFFKRMEKIFLLPLRVRIFVIFYHAYIIPQYSKVYDQIHINFRSDTRMRLYPRKVWKHNGIYYATSIKTLTTTWTRYLCTMFSHSYSMNRLLEFTLIWECLLECMNLPECTLRLSTWQNWDIQAIEIVKFCTSKWTIFWALARP